MDFYEPGTAPPCSATCMQQAYSFAFVQVYLNNSSSGIQLGHVGRQWRTRGAELRLNDT